MWYERVCNGEELKTFEFMKPFCESQKVTNIIVFTEGKVRRYPKFSRGYELKSISHATWDYSGEYAFVAEQGRREIEDVYIAPNGLDVQSIESLSSFFKSRSFRNKKLLYCS